MAFLRSSSVGTSSSLSITSRRDIAFTADSVTTFYLEYRSLLFSAQHIICLPLFVMISHVDDLNGAVFLTFG